jgi:hypothetical protein
MRSLFIVLCKFLGVFAIFEGLIGISANCGFMLFGGKISFFQFLPISLMPIILGLFLIIKTEMVASWVKIGKEEENIKLDISFLRTGIILIGLYSLINGMPLLVYHFYFSNYNQASSSSQVVRYLIEVLLSLVLIFMSKQISNLILKTSENKKQ